MGDFKVPPLSTLIGSTLPNYLKVLRKGKVHPRYYHKVILTFLVGIISNAFIPWERLRENYQSIKVNKPIFILGHWRSGTTLLHNLLCQDQNAAFITTYQSIFPHNMHSKWLFKNFVHWKIPDKRPTDDMDLGVNLPQEDDFAMANITPAFYDFFFFPDQYLSTYEKHVRFTENGDENKQAWLEGYDYLIRKALYNRKGKFPILKNPANTARFTGILEKYPDAKFIHIYRNPLTVYLSTKKFFLSLFPSVQLQKTTPEQITNIVFKYYGLVMRDYLDQRNLIPEESLYEISFEDFEKEPFAFLEEIYKKFDIDDWPKAATYIKAYYKEQDGYQKNVYKISQEELNRVQTEWGFAFEAFNYTIPENIEIIND